MVTAFGVSAVFLKQGEKNKSLNRLAVNSIISIPLVPINPHLTKQKHKIMASKIVRIRARLTPSPTPRNTDIFDRDPNQFSSFYPPMHVSRASQSDFRLDWVTADLVE